MPRSEREMEVVVEAEGAMTASFGPLGRWSRRAEEEGVPVPASGSGAAAEGEKEEKPAAATTRKKTKTVMKRLSPEEVAKVLASKPKPRSRLPPELRPRQTEMLRRHSARVDEIIRAINDLIRSSQEDYRRQLDAKGYVEIEVEVDLTDDDEPQA